MSGLHTCVASQSVLVEHPHVAVLLLHAAPAGLPVQSAATAQPAHFPVPVSQTEPERLPTQSVLAVHALTQVVAPIVGGPFEALEQIEPEGQSLGWAQPQV